MRARLRLALLLASPLLPAQDERHDAAAIKRLSDAEPSGRIAALAALARTEATPPVLEAVALALGDRRVEVRRAAVDALLALRRDLAGLRQQLVAITGEPDASVSVSGPGHFGIAPGLVRVPKPARHLAGLQDADPTVRSGAVVALCQLGQASAVYEDQILALLQDPVAEVRATVAKNIGSIGWNETIRDAVLGALKDQAAVVRHAAAETLGQDRGDAGIVAALRGAVQDPDVDVRTRVIRSLGRCGVAGAVAAADLVSSLRDREAKVRVAGLEAVRDQKLHDERAVAASIRCLDDADRKVLLAALQTVAAMQEAAGAAVPRLLQLTRHELAEVRRPALDAAYAVATGKQRGAVVLGLVEAMLDEDQQVGSRATAVLTHFVENP